MAENNTKQQKTAAKSKTAEREEEILKFWQEKEIFKKTLEKPSKGEFVFYDGPPFATGLPHYGHILQGVVKDYMGRYQTMKGKHVPRRWGWDCHGLPIENIVEKELGLKSKKDIEDFGLEKFNDIARTKVFTYVDDWKRIIPRTGRFVDMENDYRTMNPTFTETVWWVFKELHKKGLIYEGFKSMHICPHCGTTLSNFEVGQGYKDITDISVTVEFELIEDPIRTDAASATSNGTGPKTYFLAWTTTPWTLPGNVALAVNPKLNYVKIEKKDMGDGKLVRFILAKDLLEKIFKDNDYSIVEEMKGSKLIGKSYKPLFDYYDNVELKNRENGFKVYGADFVTMVDGTGIVHIAPAFGEDDLNLGNEKKLPFIQHVGMDGTFKPEVKDFAGKKVKPIEDPQAADIEVLKFLANKGTLFAKEKFIHSYPHCYRCDTPLLNYATSSWFVEITKIKEKLLEANKKIKWVPAEIGEGRFAKLIESAPDWGISRSRFWGAPIPIWKCQNEKCKEKEFIGSIDEIKKKTGGRNKFFVIRHGEAESNLTEVISSDPKEINHLTEKGKEQARVTAKNLKGRSIDIIYCSPFMRTKETAEIIAENIGYPKEKIIYDERLHEINDGEFNGKSDKEYQAYFESKEDKFWKTPKGGENYTVVKKRMTEFVYDIDAENEGKNILVVSHNTPIFLMFSGVYGYDQKQSVEMRTPGKPFIENSEIKELAFAPIPHNRNYELDLHRPFIDEINLRCKCGGIMKRIPEVFDCWFESGSMPYGEMHYPFENLNKFDPKKHLGFPADFIGEAVDQTRGWFYSMLVASVALFGESSYKNVISSGLILANDGLKMAKRLKNYTDPVELMDKYGADAMRGYLLSSPVVEASDMKFSDAGVDEVLKKTIMRLQNVYSFYEMYGGANASQKSKVESSKSILDKWILARLKETAFQITKATDNYELDRATRPIGDFVDDLSTWFLRRSRDRFKSEDLEDKNSAMLTTKTVILELSKLIAPSMPFLAEDLYLKITKGKNKESVHLEDWPDHLSCELSKTEVEIIENMKETRAIVSFGLEARAKAGIKVRQPLKSLKVKSLKLKENTKYLELIKDEVNVKGVVFDESIAENAEIDPNISEELKNEGIMRDLVRAIQELRKAKGLKPGDVVSLAVDTDESGKKIFNKFSAEISKTTGLSKINFEKIEKGETLEFEGMKFKFLIK